MIGIYGGRMGRVPLYREVKEKFIQALASGEWPPGAKIPIERELAARYGVGISTIRAAASELEAAGILSRRQGKGTFVSEHTRQSTFYRFFNLVTNGGVREMPLRTFVSMQRRRPSGEERERLELSRYGKRDEVFRLRSTFSLRGRTVGVSDATVPAALFPRMRKFNVADGTIPLYGLYQANHGVNVISVAADLSADTAPADVAKLLAIRAGSPVMRIGRRAYTYGDVPVELRVTWVNTKDCKFHLEQGSTV